MPGTIRRGLIRRRSLWPREHGAYFQLAVPLLTAFLLRRPTVTMIALTVAACLAFLANEPLLVMRGHRGARMREQDRDRARRRLAVLWAGVLATGGVGLSLAPRDAALAVMLVAVPALAVVALAWRRAEHTIAGEITAVVALTGAAVPVLIAGGASRGAALALWIAWALGFATTVLAVHRVIARHRRPASSVDLVLGVVLGAVLISCLILASWVAAALVVAPLAAVAASLVIAPPRATRLRTIGVAIVVAALGSAGVAAVAAIA